MTSYPDCTPLSDDGDDHEHRRDALHAACASLRRGAYRRRRGAVESRGGAHHGRVRHIWGALEARGLDGVWRLWLIAGILAAPSFWNASPPVFSTSAPLLVLSGLLVGFGARLGSGCTSGHGVCGLARLSPRSLAATIIFMGAGFATVFIVRHVFA